MKPFIHYFRKIPNTFDQHQREINNFESINKNQHRERRLEKYINIGQSCQSINPRSRRY